MNDRQQQLFDASIKLLRSVAIALVSHEEIVLEHCLLAGDIQELLVRHKSTVAGELADSTDPGQN